MKKLYIKGRRKLDIEYARLMIRRHGFWFVDIPRTSSTSIRVELGKQFGRAYGKLNVIESEHANAQIFEDHIPAVEMRETLGKNLWNKIFTFAMVRNPWDRTYSLFNYRKKVNGVPESWSFKDYIIELNKATEDSKQFKFHGYRYGAVDYVTDENGDIIVDFIAKYENRESDLKKIAAKIGHEKLGALHVQTARPNQQHYSEFYDDETENIIRELYQKDIELFGYDFERQE